MIEYVKDEEVRAAAEKAQGLITELQKVIFGQQELIELSVCGLLAQGHMLLEGLPGLGKTELVKAIAAAVNLEQKRVQFTPDLLPGDITGSTVMRQDEQGQAQFLFQRGPVFCNIFLADEINRASPKTQAALLEAMQERCVTAQGETHKLPAPFFVLATQNPIELEGTYTLPEAQLDRFLFKLEIYRSGSETLKKIILERQFSPQPEINKVLSADDLKQLISLTQRIYMPPLVADFIARLVEATHDSAEGGTSSYIKYGASPRAALGLASAARALALLDGRVHCGFEDVKRLALPVLRHRILLDYRAKIEGVSVDKVIEELLLRVAVGELELPANISSN